MSYFKKGDLVKLTINEDIICMVIRGSYMAVFDSSIDGVKTLEETLAADILYEGSVYCKVKCNLLKKILKHPQLSN